MVRLVIGLDAYHLKGPFYGQLICVAERDMNNKIFRLAIAIVKCECKTSWIWFSKILTYHIWKPNEKGWENFLISILLSYISNHYLFILQGFVVTEHRNRTLLDIVRSMMIQTNLPISFWGYTLETIAFILNRVPSKTVQKTPYEI